jgi:hypothetical protein
MSSTRYQKFFSLIAALAMAASVQGAAGASSITTEPFQLTGATADTQLVTFTDDGKTETGYAGLYQGTLNGQPINVFCVDPTHEINVGDSYAADAANLATSGPDTTITGGYYTGGVGSELTSLNATPGETLTAAQQAARGNEIAWLADNFATTAINPFANYSFASTDLSTDYAAVNMAIWDEAEDGGAGFAAGDGPFTDTTAADSGTVTLANDFLNLASSESNYASSTAYWIQAPGQDATHLQNYIMATPEVSPGLISGLGLCGVMLAIGLKRRRQLS